MAEAPSSHRTRRASPLELIDASGHRFVKLYGLAWEASRPRQAIVDEARALALQHIPPAGPEDRLPRCGFAVAHDGQSGRWVLVDWWQDDLLHHRLFAGDLQLREPMRAVTSGLVACVWELAVIAHERDAWVRHVLGRSVPALEAYLADTLDADV